MLNVRSLYDKFFSHVQMSDEILNAEDIASYQYVDIRRASEYKGSMAQNSQIDSNDHDETAYKRSQNDKWTRARASDKKGFTSKRFKKNSKEKMERKEREYKNS